MKSTNKENYPFKLFKTRKEIANELSMSQQWLTKHINDSEIKIPKYKLLTVDHQIKVYLLCGVSQNVLKMAGYHDYI